MFDKYIIGEGSVRNVEENGETIGFSFSTRIPYYRGLGVSMVEPFQVVVDGAAVEPEQLRFTLRDRTWTFDELAQDFESRWELTETAQVTVLVPGGLAPGAHEINVTEVLRISYLPFLARTSYHRTVQIGS